jgi:hypothetical protein
MFCKCVGCAESVHAWVSYRGCESSVGLPVAVRSSTTIRKHRVLPEVHMRWAV